MVEKVDPLRFRELAAAARDHAARRVSLYQQLAHITLPQGNGNGAPAAADSKK
jgi:hypothetical protein